MNSRLTFRLRLIATLALLPWVSLCRAQTPAPTDSLTPEAKTQVIETLLKELQANYVFPETATRAAGEIRSHQQAHDYDAVTQGSDFARLLTEHLRNVCKDAHLHVSFSAKPLPVRAHSDQPSAEEIKRQKEFERLVNGGVDRAERLDGNVGYIEVRGFMEPQAAAQPIRAAMDFVANTDALIIDLRRNGGGDPETVRLLCSYLFDTTPVHLNDIYMRPGNKTEQFWTLRRVPGHRYLNREVFVLTSRRTGSGAEECSYNLQNLKRATLIGEVTWGGANPGGMVRLNDHFSAFIPVGRAINPYTKTNWEGTGVTPDISVSSEAALQTAHVLALRHLLEKATTPDAKDRLSEALRAVEANYHPASAETK